MKKQTLILQPIHNSSADIIRNFASGAPLTADQRLFLESHEKEISNNDFDPIIQYYLASLKKHKDKFHATFLLPYEKLNFERIAELKKRIQTMLKDNKNSYVIINMSQEEFLDFKDYTDEEVMFWRGNVYLTGAPLVPGGTPPVIFFRWGNFFGIVKYALLFDEKAKLNLFLYFEEMRNRTLDQCVKEYHTELKYKIALQNQITQEKNHYLKSENISHPSEPLKKSLSHYYLLHHL